MLEINYIINNGAQVIKILQLLEEDHSVIFHPDEIVALRELGKCEENQMNKLESN
jgi:hypothetical protein